MRAARQRRRVVDLDLLARAQRFSPSLTVSRRNLHSSGASTSGHSWNSTRLAPVSEVASRYTSTCPGRCRPSWPARSGAGGVESAMYIGSQRATTTPRAERAGRHTDAAPRGPHPWYRGGAAAAAAAARAKRRRRRRRARAAERGARVPFGTVVVARRFPAQCVATWTTRLPSRRWCCSSTTGAGCRRCCPTSRRRRRRGRATWRTARASRPHPVASSPASSRPARRPAPPGATVLSAARDAGMRVAVLGAHGSAPPRRRRAGTPARAYPRRARAVGRARCSAHDGARGRLRARARRGRLAGAARLLDERAATADAPPLLLCVNCARAPTSRPQARPPTAGAPRSTGARGRRCSARATRAGAREPAVVPRVSRALAAADAARHGEPPTGRRARDAEGEPRARARVGDGARARGAALVARALRTPGAVVAQTATHVLSLGEHGARGGGLPTATCARRCGAPRRRRRRPPPTTARSPRVRASRGARAVCAAPPRGGATAGAAPGVGAYARVACCAATRTRASSPASCCARTTSPPTPTSASTSSPTCRTSPPTSPPPRSPPPRPPPPSAAAPPAAAPAAPSAPSAPAPPVVQVPSPAVTPRRGSVRAAEGRANAARR